MTGLPHLRWITARVLFACAALILSLGPSVDAMAGAAKLSLEAGHSTAALETVASFDVIDDTLDHLPGKVGGEPQQQQLAVPLSPASSAELVPPFVAGAWNWVVSAGPVLRSRAPEGLERPPRV